MAAPSARERDDLILQVEELQRRVLILEKRLGVAPSVVHEIAAAAVPRDSVIPPDAVPVLGGMLLAIAGAYVLRALTDWGTLPAAAGVAIGLVYAFLWLLLAARAPREAKFAAAVSCATSVLIMAPLLWEAAGRLKVMPSWLSAGVLAAFALAGLALGSRHRIIATIAGVSSVVMAVALVFGSDDIVPFTVALLAIAAAMEFAAWRELATGVRAVAAVAADFTVLLFSYLMATTHGMPPSWAYVAPPVALASQLALATIYVVTAVTQIVVRRRTITFAEITQTAASLLLGIGGAVWVFREDRAVMLGLGFVALAAGLACYAVSFLLFERHNKRNFRALATFGLFLVLTGILLPFSRTGFWILACVSALACCQAARAFRLPTLGLHGAVYLLLGAMVSSATRQPLTILFGMGNTPVDWIASPVVLVAACVCWTIVAGTAVTESSRWRNQISSLAIGAQIIWVSVGMVVSAIVSIWPGAPADTVGTVIITALSVALAWTGRQELVWLLYGAMAVGGYKLVVRDFMNEHSFPLVVSLLCYGGALILLPRILRARTA